MAIPAIAPLDRTTELELELALSAVVVEEVVEEVVAIAEVCVANVGAIVVVTTVTLFVPPGERSLYASQSG